jgi:mRNA interferase MazF
MREARRGEIWVIDLGLAHKTRPCLILNINFLDHERAVVTYVPRTTSVRHTRFEVPHQMRGMDPGAFDAQGIGSIPIVKLERCLAVADATFVEQVEAAVKLWLGLK